MIDEGMIAGGDGLSDDGLSSLPDKLAKLVESLDVEDRLALQAYLEIHNHYGEFPLHLTVEALDQLCPGFAQRSLDEALKDTRDERRRLNSSTFFELLQKSFALISGWGLAFFGAWHGILILSRPDLGLASVIAGGVVMAFCIGGPAAIAYLMRNSGITLGVQTKLDEE